MKRILLLVLLVLPIQVAYAHCPLCTAAVGGGVAITRFYGVDDAIVGLWIGAFVVSTALWFSRTISKRYKNIPLQNPLLVLLALVLTVVPFYFSGLVGNAEHILGIDKLLFGIIIGSIFTYIGMLASDLIKRNRGKALFSYQTIVMVLALMVLASIAVWYAGW